MNTMITVGKFAQNTMMTKMNIVGINLQILIKEYVYETLQRTIIFNFANDPWKTKSSSTLNLFHYVRLKPNLYIPISNTTVKS